MRDDDLPTIEDDEARKRTIELLMRTDRRGYFRDEAMQREYLQILEREEARQQGGERKSLAPDAKVSIPDKRNTFGQLRREEDPDPIEPPVPLPTRPVENDPNV